MRKWLKEAWALLVAIGAMAAVLQLTWVVWNDYFLALYRTVLRMTGTSVSVAGSVALIALVVTYVARKRWGWYEDNMYSLIAARTSGKLHEWASDLAHLFQRKRRKDDFLSFFIISMSNHPFAQRTRRWVIRIISALWWPLFGVGLAGMAYRDTRTAGGYLVTVLVMALIFVAVGVRLGNALLFVFFAVWISYVLLTFDEAEGQRQAVVIGFSLLLWNVWRQWQDRIAEPPPEERPVPKPETE